MTVMALTSAPVLMGIQGSTARIWCDGAIRHPVKMEDRVGRKELHSLVSVRLGGLASTVMYPVYHVK